MHGVTDTDSICLDTATAATNSDAKAPAGSDMYKKERATTRLRTRRQSGPDSDHYPVEMTFTLNNPATTQD